MDIETRKALVEELAEVTACSNEYIDKYVMPIIDRLLADRAEESQLLLDEANRHIVQLRNEFGEYVADHAAIAAMPSGRDDNWLDDALDSVGADDIIVQRVRHPRNDIDWEHPGYTFCCDLWSHANYDDPNPDPIAGGNGTTRKAAILDAVQKAKEASGE